MVLCSIRNCNKKACAKGLCNGHYERLRRKGFLDKSPLKKYPRESSYFHPGPPIKTKNGYYIVSIGKQEIMYYHRWVMEQHLGRKLRHPEMVHHIDKNPANNDIKNLKLIESSAVHMHMEHKPQGHTCVVINCSKPTYQYSLCSGHYKRFYRHGDVFSHVPLGKGRIGRKSMLIKSM